MYYFSKSKLKKKKETRDGKIPVCGIPRRIDGEKMILAREPVPMRLRYLEFVYGRDDVS